MVEVCLGLGANLGDREDNIRRALGALDRKGCVVRDVSSLYETEPWGVDEQPRFLNAACIVNTALAPFALLDAVKAIERELGRTPGIRFGPRPIDVDILLYGELVIDALRLRIPHAGMLERHTVLIPLAEIAPCLRHPVTRKTIAAHLAELGPTDDVALFPPGLAAALPTS